MVCSRAFVGIHDKGDNEGSFRCNVNGRAISFTRWHAGEPNNVGKGGEDCTEINFRNWGDKREWNDISCSRTQSFVCEIIICPAGWTNKAGKCYKFINEKKNFQDAQDFCKEIGGNLACPTSKEENEAIHSMTEERLDFFKNFLVHYYTKKCLEISSRSIYFELANITHVD